MMSSSKRVKLASEDVIDRFVSNVDVWQTIFEILEVKDRIRLEMTNKRLRILMFTCWKRVTSFDTECELMSHNPSMSRNRSAAFAAICVDRIGDALRSLTIREVVPLFVWSANLCPIGEGCPNVETINFVFESNYWRLNIPFDLFSRLKTLTVSTAGDFTRASASIFLSIPTSIEVIRGLGGREEEPFENSAQMEGFFADRPSLKEICLHDLYTRDGSKADIFRVIAERCPHLKSIELVIDSRGDNCIDYSGVVALESMKELRIPNALMDKNEVVTICERSSLVEVLELRCHIFYDMQSEPLNALGSLTKLSDLRLSSRSTDADVVAPSLVTEFVRELARNSGASLRRLEFGDMALPTAAIEALANGCGKLRCVGFWVHVGEAEPASIRFLINCIVAHPSWIPQTGERRLVIFIRVLYDYGDDAEAVMAAFNALATPAANLPAGVELIIQ